jgi:hypothetical protein
MIGLALQSGADPDEGPRMRGLLRLTTNKKTGACVLLLCVAVLLLYQSSHFQHVPAGSRAQLRSRLFRPSYCKSQALPPALPMQLAGLAPTRQYTASHTPPLSVPIATIQAFMAVHQAAEQPLKLAELVWLLNLSAILTGVGQYPAGSSSGRGVVLVGGGKKYTPPAYGCVYFLRRSGCQLLIEVWPPHEPIPPAVAADFVAFGVTLRSLPAEMHGLLRQRKFLGKQLAILASSFQEVLLLDSDNIPLSDPSFLFDELLYTETGLLIWPDFWRSEAAPGAWEALNIPPELRPHGSHEAGHDLIRLCWTSSAVGSHCCWQSTSTCAGTCFTPCFLRQARATRRPCPLLGWPWG